MIMITDTGRVYVDIESLLDLRSAILSKLRDKEDLTTYLLSEEYNFRDIDKFPMINQEEYDSINSNKTNDLIPLSLITYIVNTLKTKIENLEKRNNFYNEKKTPEIVLNVHPFKLTEQQKNIIQNLLFIKLKTNTLVTVVDLPIKDISPYFINNSNFISCFIYNFQDWMNHHSSSLEKNKLTDTLLYFPALYSKEPEQKELEQITNLGFKDLFSYTEYLLSSVANINFLPVVFYSNIVTASLYLDKFNDALKKETLSKDVEEKKDGDSSPTV